MSSAKPGSLSLARWLGDVQSGALTSYDLKFFCFFVLFYRVDPKSMELLEDWDSPEFQGKLKAAVDAEPKSLFKGTGQHTSEVIDCFRFSVRVSGSGLGVSASLR